MPKPVRYHLGKFPPKDLDWQQLIPLIGPASAALAGYESLLHAIPNAAVLLSPLTTREAVLSSRIEGTQATMNEVLEYDAGAVTGRSSAREADIKEVLNYRRAMRQAERLLPNLPISGRLLKNVHKILMRGVRGTNSAPGEFRQAANWIGPSGCTEETASFIPIPHERLLDGVTAWERYVNGTAPDKLVQLAIVHAEFEALHPFFDGNGRLGRLLIPLFLREKEILSRPMFYMSEHLEANRDAYYARLRAISSQGDWTGWAHFFLDALIKQARVNHDKAQSILALYNRLKDEVVEMTHSQYGVRALDALFERPIFQSTSFIEQTDIPGPSARRLLRAFRDVGLLKTLVEGKGRRTGRYAFRELINIAEGTEVI